MKRKDKIRWAKIYMNQTVLAIELYEEGSERAFEAYIPLTSLADPIDYIYRWVAFGER